MKNQYLFIFLASGVIGTEEFWLIDTKSSDSTILDDKTLIDCHRKELVGYDSGREILNVINQNVEYLIKELNKKNVSLKKPPKGFSYNIPLNLLENIFDFWVEKYKDKDIWETCCGLLKIRERASLKNLINNKGIKGNSKILAIEIENLHHYEQNHLITKKKQNPMWK